MYKVAVLGDRNSIYGFSALGLDVYYVESAEDATAVFREIASSERYAVIYITEQLAAFIMNEIEKFSFKPSPAVILIPGIKGNTGEGIKAVKKSIEKAVGSDILN